MENPTLSVIVPLKKMNRSNVEIGLWDVEMPGWPTGHFFDVQLKFQSLKTHLVERIVFCIQDEWWKCNAPSVHDTCGAAFGGLSDGYANEVGSRELGLAKDAKNTWFATKTNMASWKITSFSSLVGDRSSFMFVFSLSC